MRSLIIATTDMGFANGCQNRTDVAGMIGLRKQSLRVPRIYARPVLPASTRLSGPTCGHEPVRRLASPRLGRACSVKRGSHWRMLQPSGSRRSAAIG
jgi:hypothetical protein